MYLLARGGGEEGLTQAGQPPARGGWVRGGRGIQVLT